MDLSRIPQHAPIIGADGAPIGAMDRIEGRRLEIRREGALTGKKHYVDAGLIADLDARPAAARARDIGKDHHFKMVNDEETQRALFPSNFPPAGN